MTQSLRILQQKPASTGQNTSRLKHASEFKGKAAIVTLGCAKNQVDSEVMLGALATRGYEIVSDVNEAEVAIINTCGFLENALQESIDTIIDIAPLKETGKLRKLIVSGCMVERYKGNLEEELPEVDAFVDTQEIARIAEITDGVFEPLLDEAARPYFLYDDTLPRVLSTKKHTAYIKISEGCNRPCTFCIIPKIRGKMRSRDIDSVLRETESLAEQGVLEVNLVAQDLTSFGTDKREQTGGDLSELLYQLDKQGLMPWIRLLYAYPIGTSDELLSAIRELPSVCSYLDIPLQHSSEAVLKRMKRPLGNFAPKKLITKIKEQYPEIALRTTFIVGFPGETEDDVANLENFIRQGFFDNVGIFEYSKEQGTESFGHDAHIEDAEKTRRKEHLMLAQKEVVEEALTQYVGQREQVLIEGFHEDTDLLLVGRTRKQAPEVDGTVIVNDSQIQTEQLEQSVGRIMEVEFTETAGYDLVGTIVEDDVAL